MRVALICCPSWSIAFPPYNISLLKAILLENGHEAKAFDFNASAHNFLKDGDIEYWDGNNFFFWEHGQFDNILLPKISELMSEWIDSVLAYEPDFIGFTIYHTSIRCTTHFIERLRQKNDSVKIVIGGPQCFSAGEHPLYLGMADYVCTGEGEQAILDVLEVPENRAISSPLVKINELPTPDYDDYDLTDYQSIGGVSLEASRGCIAKCAFCIETHYWAYRSKKAEAIIADMKTCIEKYGSKHFRFNDSLVNGNIKEFRRFVDLLCKEKLNVNWDGYARINGEMDLDFMKKVGESGNDHLSYGIESGSQKVLNDMRKGITVEEAENNLRDGHLAGVRNHVNWMVGFPSETPLDNLHSLAFLFNNRKYMDGISPGMTCGVGDKAELKVHGERYNIHPQFFWNNYATNDFKNTAVHRWIRLKFTHIWIRWTDIVNGHEHHGLDKHFTLKSLNKEQFVVDRIDYDDCIDFSYLDRGSFASSIQVEFLSFFWIVWKLYGPCEMTLTFDYDRDTSEFGTMIVKEYNATATFKVDEGGEWVMSLAHTLEKHFEFDEAIVLTGKF